MEARAINEYAANTGKQFGQLQEYYLNLKRHLENGSATQKYFDLIGNLISGFHLASRFTVLENNAENEENLYEDIKSVNELFAAAEAFIQSRDKTAEGNFIEKLNSTVARAEKNLNNAKDGLVIAGIVLGSLALTAAVGVAIATAFVAITAAPIIMIACLIGCIGFLTTSAILHYHQSNHTFFGQNVKNHALMADVVLQTGNMIDNGFLGGKNETVPTTEKLKKA